MLERVTDPAILNHFSAHADIAPYVGGPIDFTNAMRETAVFLFGEHGGFIFEWCAPDTYEAHVMLTRDGRGAWGWNAAKQALEALGAKRVWARVDNRPLALFVRRLGFREVETRTLYPAGQPVITRIFEWRNECPQ